MLLYRVRAVFIFRFFFAARCGKDEIPTTIPKEILSDATYEIYPKTAKKSLLKKNWNKPTKSGSFVSLEFGKLDAKRSLVTLSRRSSAISYHTEIVSQARSRHLIHVTSTRTLTTLYKTKQNKTKRLEFQRAQTGEKQPRMERKGTRESRKL